MHDYKMLPAGDTALVIEFGDRIDVHISAKVLSLAQRLNNLRLDGIIETVPTIRSLIIYYESLTLSQAAVQAQILQLMEELDSAEQSGRKWQLPRCYHPPIPPHLPDV